jgi:hypothetical protein
MVYEMGGACRTYGKPDKKKEFDRLWCRQVDTIKMDVIIYDGWSAFI